MASTDYEGGRGRAVLPGVNAGRYDLIAKFRDQGTAARAVSELRAMGFADENAALLGNTGDLLDPGAGLTRADRKAVLSSSREAIWGVVGGAIVGAVLGIIVLALFHSAFGHVSAGGYIAAAIFGAIIGLTLGGLVGGIAGLDRSQAHTSTYDMQTGGGDALVGVRATEEPGVSSATEVLRHAGALTVDRKTR